MTEMGNFAKLAVVLSLDVALVSCGGLISLPFGKCRLPGGAQSYGYLFNGDACLATPRTVAITSLVTFNLPPDTVRIWNDDGTSFTLSGIVQPQDFAMGTASTPVYMLDNSPSNQRIAMVDLQAHKITTQIPLPQAVYSSSAMTFSPDGNFLFVTKGKAELSVATTPPSVVVVNLATNTVDTEIALPTTAAPQGGIAITPDGKSAYAPVSDSIPGSAVTYAAYVIDTTARKVAAVIALPNAPVHVAVTPDGTSAYVALKNSLAAIDVLTNTIVANVQFPFPTALDRIVMDPAGRYVYVTNQGPNIVIVDTITNRYIDQIKVAPMVSGTTRLRISGDGRLLYSIDQGDPFVNLVDASARTVLSRTRVTTFPAGQTGWNLFDVMPLQ